jgi:hypothetical protein
LARYALHLRFPQQLRQLDIHPNRRTSPFVSDLFMHT